MLMFTTNSTIILKQLIPVVPSQYVLYSYYSQIILFDFIQGTLLLIMGNSSRKLPQDDNLQVDYESEYGKSFEIPI